MEEREYEFGLDSFMAVTAGSDGETIGGDQVVRDTVEEGVLADEVGIDSFNIGEHYRHDMMDQAAHGRDGALDAGSGPAVQQLRDAGRHLRRTRAADPGAWFGDRVLPAVRLRPPRLRRHLRGETGAVRRAAPRR